jgi:hypothetical protein
MINKRNATIKIALVATAFSSSSLQAMVISGVDYDTNISFPTISTTVFSSPQTFNLTGDLAGWSVTVSGHFSDSNYLSSPTLPITISTNNLTGAPWQNPNFPSAQGLYFSQLPNNYAGNNLTVSFSFEFIRSGGLDSLQLAVYGGESSDNEIDTLTHTGGVFSNFTLTNIASSTGQGTNSATFSSTPDPSGIGQFITTTTVNSGNVITWNYDYTLNTGEGKNMIAFNAASVPEPSTGAFAGSALLLGAFTRRRSNNRNGNNHHGLQ